MKRHRWQELGKALKSLREGRDLAQKEIADLLGESLSERGLRTYESGQQRPSRERLLKMLTAVYGLKNRAEIDRHLSLGGFSGLSTADLARYELDTGMAAPGPAGSTVAGAPEDFRIEVSTLIVTDGSGREVWRHQFPSRFAWGTYDGQDRVKRCAFGDVDGDGGVETFFVYMPVDFGSVGSTLYCFSASGEIRWQFAASRTLTDMTRIYFPPYFISNVLIIPMPDAQPLILVSSNHYLHNPNQIAMLDATGKLVSEYWHSGHLLYITHADLNGDGVEEILLGGVNNGYRQATMVILDPRNIKGASRQPSRRILGFPKGTEKARVLFPKTCVAKDASYNRVCELRVTQHRRIMLAVAEGISEARNPGIMIYELDFDLNVLSARPDGHLKEVHHLMEQQGVLDHSWTEKENDRLKAAVVVMGSP